MRNLFSTLCVAASMTVGLFAASATTQAAPVELYNPDWSITLTDYGYSDLLFDRRPGFEFREYLSGEWGGAVRYDLVGGGSSATLPRWIEPDFIFPDWTTNSNFGVVSGKDQTVLTTNEFGLGLANSSTSTVSNDQLEIKQTYRMIDTVSGIAQGQTPASDITPDPFTISNRYVLEQTYEFKNVSSSQMTNLKLFQFLHGLHSEVAVYDDRAYDAAPTSSPDPHDSFRYDISMHGESEGIGGGGGPFAITENQFGIYAFDDNLTMHSEVAPEAWEVGYYGIDPIDDHAGFVKPSAGVHLSIEADSLSGADFFGPPELWVSGAQKFGIASSLNPGETASFTVLLSISTEQEFIGPIIPEPSSFLLLGTGALGLMFFRRKRSQA